MNDERAVAGFIREHPPGSPVTGTACHIADFGVFISLDGGLTALLLVVNIQRPPDNLRGAFHPGSIYQVGDRIKAKVEQVTRGSITLTQHDAP